MRHLDGFATYGPALRERLGIDARLVEVPASDMMLHEVRAWQPDVVVFAPSFSDTPDQLRAICTTLRAQPNAPRLVYFDTFDQTSSPHFSVLPVVDRYLKSKLLRDVAAYQCEHLGGNPWSDFAARHLHCDLAGWTFGSTLDPVQAHKLRVCWGFGASRDFAKLVRLGARFAPNWKRRWYDINRRIGLPPDEPTGAAQNWYAASRRYAARMLEPLSQHHRCTGVSRVSRRRYLLELSQSKIVFSPFGWGELCFRDYEAAAAGCLLVKPAMDHMQTSPDIFVDQQTYVSVAWDLSNLDATIKSWLAKPHDAERVAQACREALERYFDRQTFVDDVARAFEGVLPDASRPAPPGKRGIA